MHLDYFSFSENRAHENVRPTFVSVTSTSFRGHGSFSKALITVS